MTRAFKDPGWWTVILLFTGLICQAAAFVSLTQNDLRQIRESLARIEEKVSEQDKRLLKLEWERDERDRIQKVGEHR